MTVLIKWGREKTMLPLVFCFAFATLVFDNIAFAIGATSEVTIIAHSVSNLEIGHHRITQNFTWSMHNNSIMTSSTIKRLRNSRSQQINLIGVQTVRFTNTDHNCSVSPHGYPSSKKTRCTVHPCNCKNVQHGCTALFLLPQQFRLFLSLHILHHYYSELLV